MKLLNQQNSGLGLQQKVKALLSLIQVTEHHCVELKDQEISQETKERFEKLEKYPKVFFH